MPAWYDILEMDIDRRVDVPGLLNSAAAVQELLDRELERGIGADKLVLAGFSQGGAVAYQLGLTCGLRLAGLLTMSTYLATADTIEISPVAREIPILIQHGEWDPVVPEILARQAVARLEQEGCRLHYQWYPIEHGVCPEQISDISRWLQTVLQE
jgi:phospholipase/carboxylesterase